MAETKYYTLMEAAEKIGVAPITLKRWLLTAKVDEVTRDRNNWRRFTDADVRRIKGFADKTTPPIGKRK
ncbi:MAG: MerR family transcriptional regulator [Bryobacteraceae bacterium]